MTKYIDVMIKPCYSGFGEYDTERHNGEPWDNADDLLAELHANCDGDITELTDDADLPAGVADIRDAIHNEPSRVFVVVPWGVARGCTDAWYFGIAEIDA